MFAASLAVWAGCITPSEKKDMQNDIFNVQTRLLTLERKLQDTSKDARSTGETAYKRLANTQSDLEKILRDLQQIKGDIDSLRIGVVTGQLPGQPQNESSLKGNITRVEERLESLEKSQNDLLEALRKAGLNTKPPKKAEEKSENSQDTETAFSH
jgi:DNA repair exonuclease SbcCD ATPase subunit